jgi:phosphatidylserine decarboxylase
MKFHREGNVIMGVAFLGLSALNLGLFYLVNSSILIFSLPVTLIFFGLVVQFFRVPSREVVVDEEVVLCPADGKVVVIEETKETEYLKDRRIQVSIFMSPLNVHINWFPVAGVVSYVKYHAGKYLVAWHPKSSTDNERTTVAVKTKNGIEILFRQIAGAVARRIICYANEKDIAKQGSEFGFIKFGSRVDVFLPLDAIVEVTIDQKVKGTQTILARLPKANP